MQAKLDKKRNKEYNHNIMKQTKFLPRIFNQRGDSCQSYALAGLMEYLIFETYGKEVKLKPYEFYTQIRSNLNGREPKIAQALQYAQMVGMKDENGDTWTIKSYKHVWRPWWYNQPMLLSINLEVGEPFKDRLDKEGKMYARIGGYHEVVCLEKIDNYLSCANSWGEKFGIDGYFYIPKTLASKIVWSGYKLTV